MRKDELEYLLKKINHRMLSIEKGDMVETCPIGIIDFNLWEWPQGVGLYGMWNYYLQSHDEKYISYIREWFENRMKEGIPERNVNTTAPMLTLACLYEKTGDERYGKLCGDWARWIMAGMPRTEDGALQHIVSGSENRNQVWDDTLFMTVLFLAKWSVITENREMQQEAVYQFLIHIQYLYDTKTGLWFHGWNFDGRHNFAKALWARGNCWITVAIPEFLSMMGERVPGSVRRFLIGTLRNQVCALERLQCAGGLWTTLLNEADSYEEASASAGFACGILKAVRLGYLEKAYRKISYRALDGLLRCVRDDGTVEKVSYGTGISMKLEDYRRIPLVPMAYGQSLMVLFLCEMLEDPGDEENG